MANGGWVWLFIFAGDWTKLELRYKGSISTTDFIPILKNSIIWSCVSRAQIQLPKLLPDVQVGVLELHTSYYGRHTGSTTGVYCFPPQFWAAFIHS